MRAWTSEHKVRECGHGTVCSSRPRRTERALLPQIAWGDRRLLDDSGRAGVWPDSVQVIGGTLSKRLPTSCSVWLTIGLRPAGHRDEAWLKKGLPCS